MRTPKNSSAPRTEGNRRKNAALRQLQAANRDIIEQGCRALVRCLLIGESTIDDVRLLVDLPAGVNPKCFGVVPTTLMRAGIAEAVGYRTTDRPRAHRRPVRLWRLVDRDKAEAWLIAHPCNETGPTVAPAEPANESYSNRRTHV
jgi:hypothetical protein